MTWKLWVDDQLEDPTTPIRHPPRDYLGAKSSEEAKELVRFKGMPSVMHLDHDLGGNDTIMLFLVWLANEFPDGPVPEYYIHSMNPLAGPSITSYLDSWKRSLLT